MKRFQLLLLSLCFSSATLVSAWYDKRALPLPATTTLPNRLGNYTHSHDNVKKPTYSCVSIGECDVCTSFELKTAAYCLEYGNKEQVECQWDDPAWAETRNKIDADDDVIRLPTHRGCPWVKQVEKWRLIKFETINFVVAVYFVSLFIWRQRKLAREKYQQLNQRIGVSG